MGLPALPDGARLSEITQRLRERTPLGDHAIRDRGGDLVTLRPEATASIVRAYIQHKLYSPDPAQRLYMIGPMFRRERPQKGRYRQFYQIDAEILGVASPLADAQLIYLLLLLLERLKIDPAIASSIFVTTFTDMCGFFLLLGLATRFLV